MKTPCFRFVVLPRELIRPRRTDEEAGFAAVEHLEELHSADHGFRIAAVEYERRTRCLHRGEQPVEFRCGRQSG